MSGFRLIIRSAAVRGAEDAYERWYKEIHRAEIVALGCFSDAELFRIETADRHAAPFTHLSMLAIVGDDAQAALARLGEAFAGDMTPTDALDTAVAPETLIVRST